MHGTARPNETQTSRPAERMYSAARALLGLLEKGQRLDRTALQAAMTEAFGATDAGGAWVWKQAYDAAETAVTLLLRRYGGAMLARAEDPAAMLALIRKVSALEPPQTRRDEVQPRFQQFSTPLELAWIVATAADVQPNDIVLEPSAGTGTLAVLAALKLDASAGGRVALNELTSTRAGLLRLAFRDSGVTRHDAESISDLLPDLWPTDVVMNPPFSRAASRTSIQTDMDLRHVRAAYQALRPGGRLAAVTSSGCEPADAAWRHRLRPQRAAARHPLHAGGRRKAVPHARHIVRDAADDHRQARPGRCGSAGRGADPRRGTGRVDRGAPRSRPGGRPAATAAGSDPPPDGSGPPNAEEAEPKTGRRDAGGAGPLGRHRRPRLHEPQTRRERHFGLISARKRMAAQGVGVEWALLTSSARGAVAQPIAVAAALVGSGGWMPRPCAGATDASALRSSTDRPRTSRRRSRRRSGQSTARHRPLLAHPLRLSTGFAR